MTEPIDQATKVMSNTDGEDTQKVSLGELLLNAGTRIVDLEKQSNDQVEIITHLEKQLASLREQLKQRDKELERLNNDLLDALDLKNGNGPTALSMLSEKLKQKEQDNRESLLDFIKWSYKADPEYADRILQKYLNSKKNLSA